MNSTELTIEGAIATLRLSRPQVLNAINEAMVDEIEATLDRVESDRAILALAIVGTGRAFCVGSDLKEGGGDAAARIARMHRLILRLVSCPKVTVAVFNGLALGGGLEIGMACTFRVAAPEARMGLPEVTHALMPAYGGTQLLPRLVGLSQALQMALSGELIDAPRALVVGLIDAIADDPQAAAVTLVERCSRGGAVAQREIRRAMLEGYGRPLAEGLGLEAEGALRVAASDEAHAAIAAFGAGKDRT